MVALLVGMGIMAILLTVAMPAWKQMVVREKEEELVFRGEQYARAIGLFQKKFANAAPPNLDALVEQRFLRKKYKDPITNDDFIPVLQGQAVATPGSGSQTAARPGQTATTPPATAPGTGRGTSPTPGIAPIGTPGAGPAGGIVGVTSKSKDKSLRLYKGRSHYNEWAFVYTPPQTPAGGAPGAATPGVIPGQRGQRGTNPATTPTPGQPPGRGRPGGPGGPNPFGSPNPFETPGQRGRGPGD